MIIAAAKVGGIYANSNMPFDFILENLKIQNNLIELAWEFGVKGCISKEVVAFTQGALNPFQEYLLSSPLESTTNIMQLPRLLVLNYANLLENNINLILFV